MRARLSKAARRREGQTLTLFTGHFVFKVRGLLRRCWDVSSRELVNSICCKLFSYTKLFHLIRLNET